MVDSFCGYTATVLPEVGGMVISLHPMADDRGDEQQHQDSDVEDDDTQQQEQHSGGQDGLAELGQRTGMTVRGSSEWPQAQNSGAHPGRREPQTAARAEQGPRAGRGPSPLTGTTPRLRRSNRVCPWVSLCWRAGLPEERTQGGGPRDNLSAWSAPRGGESGWPLNRSVIF